MNNKSPTREDPKTKKHSSLDLTLCSPNLYNIQWQVLHHKAKPEVSDHFPINIKIPLNNTEDTIYHSTWNLNSNRKWKTYKFILGKKLQNSITPNNTNEYNEQITDKIYTTALTTMGYRSYQKGYKPWWNNKIKRYKSLTKKTHRKMEKLMLRHPDYFFHLTEYKILKTLYKNYNKHKIQLIRIAKKKTPE